ncbi:hypothetical protein [Lichenicoccus roseus]|uniref:Uncharacterized protein n=1 Tax=Lichenicoccus roseus TaxID=2683649 RepID=A0A5R9J4X5_9PROT|nr:hypothetical protein [Lichenicoccus roseus]TLU72029.1 hypothetical protein FE263_12905 [Lichenicoccus roseus]
MLRALPAGAGPLADPVANIARNYAALAQDILDHTHHPPGFDVAVSRHRMLDAITRSAKSGTVQSYF